MPHAEQKINLVRLAHVNYIHANMDAAHQFLLDFGFTEADKRGETIFYKGYGTEPFLYSATQGSENAFGGAAFVVESLADLELASKTLPNATSIHALDAPGGGQRVTFYDPIDNFPFHLVCGQDSGEEVTTDLRELEYNFPNVKHRHVNKTQRFKKAPAPIHKLGHFGCCVTDFAKAFEFYTTRFNLKPSDVIHDKSKDFMSFLHLDRGMEQVDHHCFFFFEGPKFHVHHSSFEVNDFDMQSLGHQWLREKKYDLAWGVGRHVLGSQIFDYWYDPSKFILEHYVDGDLVDETTPIARSEAGPDSLHIWGPPLPASFLQ